MKKVFKFVKGKKDEKKESVGIPSSQSRDLSSPARTPEDEKFLGLENSAAYIVDFCGKDKTLTKLHKAAWQGHMEKLRSALKKIDVDAVDRHNRSALHFAVARGHPNIVWYLLGNNAKVTICDDDGCTPLLRAIESGHKDCMTLLLEHNADINRADYQGNTGLHMAAKQGSSDIASALLAKGAELDVANSCGDYPLHIATRSQNKDLVELFLRNRASVNVFDRENRTPLMLAAKTGNILLVKLFVEYGAQLSIVDSNGWTAEDYALLGGHEAVANEFKNNAAGESAKTENGKMETQRDENESESARSNPSSVTWCDDSLPTSDSKDQIGKKIKEFFERKTELKEEKDEDLSDSPDPGAIPPPCRPPRSWEIIQAGMIDANQEGSESKRRNITTLGTLHSRRESFAEAGGSRSESAGYTLSLNRRKQVKKENSFARQRLSFNEEESLRCLISNASATLKEIDKMDLDKIRKMETSDAEIGKASASSEWDSDSSFRYEIVSGRHTVFGSAQEKIERSTDSIAKSESLSASESSCRTEALNGIDETWVANEQTCRNLQEKLTGERAESSWDSEDPENNERDPNFPPPPSGIELGVNMAKSIGCLKGISIDRSGESFSEKNAWKNYHENQTPPRSAERLDEKEKGDLAKADVLKAQNICGSRSHARHQSISGYKWRSEELPQNHKPVDRLIDVNRRINEQLQCYDQALRELAEMPFARKQDVIVSALDRPSTAQNYYSLPATKNKAAATVGVVQTDTQKADSEKNCYYLKSRQVFDESGPLSLPFSVNDDKPIRESEKAEKLREEEEAKPMHEGKSDVAAGKESRDVARETKKSKRHMLLAMREVKHAVHVANTFKTSIDDQILSPLTKPPESPDLEGGKRSSSEEEEEQHFFKLDLLARQETVIEKVEFGRKSSSSETAEEPTLWLQDEGSERGSRIDSEEDFDSSAEMGMRSYSPSRGRNAKKVENKGGKSILQCGATSFAADGVATVAAEPPASKSAAGRRSANSRSTESVSSDKEGYRDEDQDVPIRLPEVNSPDVSFSSGPIETIGEGKDSGSEADSSHNEVSPTHGYSLQTHHEWLKNHLKMTTNEKNKLEQATLELSEKAERLQYELDDAKEAVKSKDEVILLLQAQLTRMESAYTKSLEEAVHTRLQLTNLEQEILHLKELCFKYEEEKEKTETEVDDEEGAALRSRIRVLEEEKEKIAKDFQRIEGEKNALEKRLQELTPAEIIDQCQRWKERCENLEESAKENDEAPGAYVSYLKTVNEEHLRRIRKLENRTSDLEKMLLESKNRNVELEVKLQKLTTDVDKEKLKYGTEKELEEPEMEINRKNLDAENYIRKLEKSAEEKYLRIVREKEKELEALNKEFEAEREIIVRECEERLHDMSRKNEEEQHRKKENEKLKKIIKSVQDQFLQFQINLLREDGSESIRNELTTLKDQCTLVSKSMIEIQNKGKEELDSLMRENLNLKKEINELKAKMTKDVEDEPKYKQDLLKVVNDHANVKTEIVDMKNQMQLMDETLNRERKLLEQYKEKNTSLERQISKLQKDAKQSQKPGSSSDARSAKRREISKEGELAWTSLYGIKLAKKGREDSVLQDDSPIANQRRDDDEALQVDCIYEKSRRELRQKLEENFRAEEEARVRRSEQNCELLELRRQMMHLESRMADEKALRRALEKKLFELDIAAGDKERLKKEMNSLRQKIERDAILKSEMELLEREKEQRSQKKLPAEDSASGGFFGGDYKAKCERLAAEMEKSKDIRRKVESQPECYRFEQPDHPGEIPREVEISEELKAPVFAGGKFHVASGNLEPEIKTKLNEELERSIQKHLTDLSKPFDHLNKFVQ